MFGFLGVSFISRKTGLRLAPAPRVGKSIWKLRARIRWSSKVAPVLSCLLLVHQSGLASQPSFHAPAKCYVFEQERRGWRAKGRGMLSVWPDSARPDAPNSPAENSKKKVWGGRRGGGALSSSAQRREARGPSA
eukprot:gene14717-biopygen2779